MQRELVELGFKGRVLGDMMVLVSNEEEMEELQNFILLNERTYKSSLELAYKFKLHLKKNSSYSCESFCREYADSHLEIEKIEALQKLFFEKINLQQLKKVESLINNGIVKLSRLYDFTIDNRNQYTFNVIVNLL